MKHAYLIIAHKNQNQLRTLIKLLDDPRNDIFLFVNEKSKINVNGILSYTKYSKLLLADGFKVFGGIH